MRSPAISADIREPSRSGSLSMSRASPPLLDPKLSSEVATFLSDVEDAEDYTKGKITDVNQVAVKATGEHTLQVVTAKAALGNCLACSPELGW